MDLPNSGIEPESPALQVNSLPTELSGKPEIDGYPHPIDKETETQRGSQSARARSEQELELS